MIAKQVLEKATDYAKKYRAEAQQSLVRNNHMNGIEDFEKVEQRIIDAVLTDFINYIASKYGIDYGLYSKNLL